MPTSYYAILVLLSEAPERALRMNDLAVATQSSPSRMSHAIGRLEKAGWVRRESCPNDRRGWYAKLTDEGLATLEAAAPRHLESVRAHLFDRLLAGTSSTICARSRRCSCPTSRRSTAWTRSA